MVNVGCHNPFWESWGVFGDTLYVFWVILWPRWRFFKNRFFSKKSIFGCGKIFWRGHNFFSRGARAKIFFPRESYCIGIPDIVYQRKRSVPSEGSISIFDVNGAFLTIFEIVRARKFWDILSCGCPRAPKIFSQNLHMLWGFLRKKISEIGPLAVEILSFTFCFFFISPHNVTSLCYFLGKQRTFQFFEFFLICGFFEFF